MEEVILVLLIYLVIMNVAGFAIMGIDKRRAVRHEWRISEAALFMTAVFGGGIGCVFGMYAFRHKTRHWYCGYAGNCAAPYRAGGCGILLYYVKVVFSSQF